MFTIFTLISTLTTKHRVCVKGASKQSPKPQEFYRAGTAPPGFKIPGSATDCTHKILQDIYNFNNTLTYYMINQHHHKLTRIEQHYLT